MFKYEGPVLLQPLYWRRTVRAIERPEAALSSERDGADLRPRPDDDHTRVLEEKQPVPVEDGQRLLDPRRRFLQYFNQLLEVVLWEACPIGPLFQFQRNV